MIALYLGIIAGFAHVFAFLIYNKQMLKGESCPNTATWTLWMFMSIVNCLTYLMMSGDWVKTILPIVSTAACMGTFCYSLVKGKLSKLDPWDVTAMLLGFIAVIAWYVYRNATTTNMLLQLPFIVSFVPTYRGVWRSPRLEKPLPWFIWSGAYILSISTVLLRWRGQPQDLVYPINCLILHAVVGLLTYRRKPTAEMQ